MSIATPPFFCFPFAWSIFFHPLTFSLNVSLGLKWVPYRQHIYGSCFLYPFSKPVSLPHTSIIFWLLFSTYIHSYFPTVHDPSGSSCIFIAQLLELAIPLRSPGSFYWGIRSQDLSARYTSCCWVVFDSRPSQMIEGGQIHVGGMYIYT